jgi:hypothetical protein
LHRAWLLWKMSSVYYDDELNKFSKPIMVLICARLKKEEHTQEMRAKYGISRRHNIEKGLCKRNIPLSSNEEGKIKPSPLRNVINAADVVPLLHNQELASITPVKPMIFLLKIQNNQNTTNDGGESKRPRFG